MTAPVAGTLTLPTLKDQVVSVGDEVGKVSPGTLSVTGTLTPDQQYRLVGAPTQAARHPHGWAGSVRVHRPAGRRGADHRHPAASPTARTAASSGTVTCADPGGDHAFLGSARPIEITNGTAADAVVVPITAVQGTVQAGNVWVVAADGSNEKRAVAWG